MASTDIEAQADTGSKIDEQDFISLARERYQFGLDADMVDRTEAEDDNRFANSSSDDNMGQWAEEPLRARRMNHRPVLQWNRIPTYVQQVVNDGRQNKPAIKISAGDGGLKETADFLQGRVRHIEYESDADIAYDTAREQQTTSGRGFMRVSTEYIPGTFDQRIYIERIENQFSVVMDPGAQRYDRSDMDWCFVVQLYTRAQFRREFGEKALQAVVDWAGTDSLVPGWYNTGKDGQMIQVADYWLREHVKRTLALIRTPDGNELPMWKDEIPVSMQKFIAAEREDDDSKICKYIISGAQILQGPQEWLGTSIPIVPVWGREAVVAGLRRTYSLIRNAKDPQRLVNLYVSNIAEQIAMMPKAPYEAPVGSIADNHLSDWRDAGMTAKAILFYKQWDESGRELARPSRVVNEPPIQALTIGLMQAIDAIKASMGIFDASLGARSNETTGIAIRQRKASAEIINYHFADNEARSRKRVGEILLELIPKVDKPGSRVPTRSENGQTEIVPVGTSYMHPKTGREVIHNLGSGDYGVVVSTGLSYDSARQEEHDRLVEMIQAEPAMLWIVGDQILRTSDFPGSDEMAERMENAIKAKMPGIIPNKPEEGKPPLPPEVQQFIAQLQQELATTQQFAQGLHEKLETKQPELENDLKLKQMELDFQREKLAMDNTVKVAVEELKVGITAELEAFRQEMARLQQQQALSHAAQLAQGQQQHEQEMAEQAQAGVLEQQQQAADLAPKGTE